MADGPGPLGDLGPTPDEASATDANRVSDPDPAATEPREEPGQTAASGEERGPAGTEAEPVGSPGSPGIQGAVGAGGEGAAEEGEAPQGVEGAEERAEGAERAEGVEERVVGAKQRMERAEGVERVEGVEERAERAGGAEGAEGAEGVEERAEGAEGAVGGAFPVRRVEISVCEPERRADGREVFTVYLVESRAGEGPPPRSLWRRYSEFELLRRHLLAAFPHVVVPPLPEKRAEFAWQKLSSDNMDPDFVERRRAGLEAFLLRVASHAELARDAVFSAFLVRERGWREAAGAAGTAGSRAVADSRPVGAPAAAPPPRVEIPDRRFAELEAYAEELRAAIGAILKARARAADRLYGVYKVHANYGRVFSEWSALERRETGDGLQSAGHHMDAHAASVDDLLEEEEHYADRLKEYLRFADALRRVCREAELRRAGVEALARELALEKRRRDEPAGGAARPFSLRGVAGKLFGREAAEAREARAERLGARVALDEAALAEREAEAAEFSRRAAADVARFQRQKVRDVREALVGYAVTQIGVCKKGIGVWSNAKESFGKM